MSKHIITSANYGPMIVNLLDTGVGWQITTWGIHEPEIVELGKSLASKCYEYYGKNVRILDVGANIGSCAVPWAQHMKNWGHVIAYEPQEITFYTLAGNIVLNNAMNARAINAAVGLTDGIMKIPVMNHNIPGNYGGLHLHHFDYLSENNQSPSYKEEHLIEVKSLKLDSEKFDRVDIIKIDVEGMELEVLQGATNLIWSMLPVIIIEFIHCGEKAIKDFLYFDYECFKFKGNLICVPTTKYKLLDFVKSLDLKNDNELIVALTK